MATLVGVDVGGTFSDFVFVGAGPIRTFKAPTSNPQSVGIIDMLGRESGGADLVFLHGTTAATNALLEHEGGRVALVTSPGFEDLIEIGRQKRPSLYDLAEDRPEPLVGRDHRIGHEDLPTTLSKVGDLEPDAISVAFINSYRDGSDELALARALSEAYPTIPISVSSRLSPGFREYERFATTVLNAYLSPVIGGYLDDLAEGVDSERMFVMSSAGGLLTFPAAREAAGQLTLSGPAGGVVAALALRDHHERGPAISFDMGGTSTDVARLDVDGMSLSPVQQIGRRVNRVSSMPIHTVGAGGGSIAWVDSGGALRVGPMSAGADPGPASYGRGSLQPTVTDANVYLGYIPEAAAFGTGVEISRAAAETALRSVASQIGMSPEEVAIGVLEVVDAHMERAIRSVSVEQGFDPGEAVLIAYGGAGGLHASRLARRLRMRAVMVPPHAGVFSAVGLLLARPRVELLETVLEAPDSSPVAATTQSLRKRAVAKFESTYGVEPDTVEILIDARYQSQSHELTLPYRQGMVGTDFAREHETRFGFQLESGEVEVVNVRSVASGRAPVSWAELTGGSDGEPRPSDSVEAGITRDSLTVGQQILGPILISETTASILLGPDEKAVVLDDGTLEITW